MATILVGIVLVFAVGFAIFTMKRKKGKGSDCASCAGCSSCPGCSSSSACKSMGGLDSDCSRLD